MSLWIELKRRNVFRIAAAYVVIGWLMLQIADIVLGFTGAPDWVGKALIALLVLGFVPVLALAWVFEVGPHGIRVDDGSADRSHGPQARRLDVITLGAVVLVVLLMIGQHLGPALTAPESTTPSESDAVVETESHGAAESPPRSEQQPPPEPDPWEPPPGSIAALPLTNRSAIEENRYFVDGIHDELLTELARNANLTVISRTSVMEYAETAKNLREIGRELGVANILEGAVQRSGDQVRITVQLIDAATDAHIWADTYDRQLTPENLFAIQTDIATEIAATLGRQIAPASETTERDVPTTSTGAYDLFLQARGQSTNFDEALIRKRIFLYGQALELDPEFAAAMGELGREHINLYWFITRRNEERELGGEWIDRALTLQADNPRLRLAKAEYHYRAHLDYDAALSQLDRAAGELSGSAEAIALRAYIKRRQDKPFEALELLQEAALLDPRSVEILASLAETYWLIGNLESAERWHRRVEALPADQFDAFSLLLSSARFFRLGEPPAKMSAASPEALAGQLTFFAAEPFHWFVFFRDYDLADRYLDALAAATLTDQFAWYSAEILRARLAQARGNPEQARALAESDRARIESELQTYPDDYRIQMAHARALALLGRTDDARAAIERAQAQPVPQRDAMIASELAAQQLFILALIADSEEVADAVEAYLERDMRYWGFDGLILDPAFDRHREHPAFQALEVKYSRTEQVK